MHAAAEPSDLAALAAAAAQAAGDAERDRRLPQRLVDEIAAPGLFRMCVPAAVGGLESHPRELVTAVEAIAAGDGAAGWCLAINATSGLVGGYLPEADAREIFGGPTSIAGGVFAPRGSATPTGTGHIVTGRWPFASGCEHCDWLMGGCAIGDDVRLMLAPRPEVQIHDTWHPMGLRGSGSHDIEMSAIEIPAGHSASVITGTPTAEGALYAFPLFGLLAVAIGAVCIGIGRGALDETIALATARTPTGSRRTAAERPATQAAVAIATARLEAARALLHDAIEEAWQQAATHGEVPTGHRAALRLAATHATTTGAEAATTAYKLGGGAAVYETRTALARRFRDVHTASQHMLVAPATNELTGRLLLNLPTDVTQL